MEKKLSFLILFLVLALAGCGTSLGKAVSSGDRATVIALLNQGADVNEMGRSDFTPLHWAAYYGKDEMAKLLLDKGAKPNVQAGKYGTPLTMAAQYGFTEVARLLLEKGADPNMADYYGKTPLQLAEARGYPEIIKLLNPQLRCSSACRGAQGKTCRGGCKASSEGQTASPDHDYIAPGKTRDQNYCKGREPYRQGICGR